MKTVKRRTDFLAPIETASFFVEDEAKRSTPQKRYSEERDKAPGKIIISEKK